MPVKINMIISNGNPSQIVLKQMNAANLSRAPLMIHKASSAINAPMIARIHNVRPGCGSCGRH